jgi:hypothetical protein
MRLLYSAQTPADVLGRTVLGPETMITLTRQVPGNWQEQTGRINADMQTRRAFRPTEQPWIFACGATRRNLDRVDAFAGQDGVEGGGQLAGPVADEEPMVAARSMRSISRIASLLGGPGSGWVAGPSEDVQIAVGDFQGEEDVDRSQG